MQQVCAALPVWPWVFKTQGTAWLVAKLLATRCQDTAPHTVYSKAARGMQCHRASAR